MSAFPALENKLDAAFKQWAPEFPDNGRRTLVRYLPWVSLILGLVTLYTAYVVWHWAHVASQVVTYANNLSASYGGPRVATNYLTLGIWLSVAVLAVEAVIYLVAFPGVRGRKRAGWNLLFYGLLLNVVYGAVIMFTAYGDLGNFIGTIVGSGVGLYLLFQIRDTYTPKARVTTSRPTGKPARKKTKQT